MKKKTNLKLCSRHETATGNVHRSTWIMFFFLHLVLYCALVQIIREAMIMNQCNGPKHIALDIKLERVKKKKRQLLASR